jgi:hypothetical protein
MLGGIEHHLDNPLDIPLGRRQRANLDPERRAIDDRT